MTNRLEQLAAITEAYRQKQAQIEELQLELKEIEQFTQQVRAVLDVPFEKQAEEIEGLARVAGEALEALMSHDLFKLTLDETPAFRSARATLSLVYEVSGGELRRQFHDSLEALKGSLSELVSKDENHADF